MTGVPKVRVKEVNLTSKFRKHKKPVKGLRNRDRHLFQKLDKLEKVLGIRPTHYLSKNPADITPEQVPLHAPFIKRHPFSKYIRKHSALNSKDLSEIIAELNFSMYVHASGAIPAAINPATDYSQHSWTRDTAIIAYAMAVTNHRHESNKALGSLAVFYARKEQRDRFISFHYHEDPHAKYRYGDPTSELPHIRAKIDENGAMIESDQHWSHSQLDAIGMWLFVTFKLANLGLLDLQTMDEELNVNVNTDNALDSIFSVALKFMYRIKFWHQHDHGPWEDHLAPSRASSVGIGIAAFKEAKKFFEKNKNEMIAVYEAPEGPSLIAEINEVIEKASKVLEFRLPKDGSYAIETETFPADSALSFLLFPFNPDLNLQQEKAILSALYRERMGELGFSRRDRDEYVGKDYIYNMEHPCYCDPEEAFYRAAQWTLFDPLIAAYYYQRFINSSALDKKSFIFADRHLRRSLLAVTKSKDTYRKVYSGNKVIVPKGRLPEAYFYDSKLDKWRPNENSPLLMAEAALAMALERAAEACKIWDLINIK